MVHFLFILIKLSHVFLNNLYTIYLLEQGPVIRVGHTGQGIRDRFHLRQEISLPTQ
jgi:hypothetical protein